MAGVPGLARSHCGQGPGISTALAVDPETEVTVTSGATEALFCAMAAVIHPGDEAIVFDPAYDSYEPGIRLAGRVRPVACRCSRPRYRVDWDLLEAQV